MIELTSNSRRSFPAKLRSGKSAAFEVLMIVEADREPKLFDFVPVSQIPASDTSVELARGFHDALDSMAADQPRLKSVGIAGACGLDA